MVFHFEMLLLKHHTNEWKIEQFLSHRYQEQNTAPRYGNISRRILKSKSTIYTTTKLLKLLSLKYLDFSRVKKYWKLSQSFNQIKMILVLKFNINVNQNKLRSSQRPSGANNRSRTYEPKRILLQYGPRWSIQIQCRDAGHIRDSQNQHQHLHTN